MKQLIPFLFMFFTVSLHAQPQTKIGAYEFIHSDDFGEPHSFYQMHPLFVKNDSGWIVTLNYNKKQPSYLLYKGTVSKAIYPGKAIEGYSVEDAETYSKCYKPSSLIKLTGKYFSRPFQGADASIKKQLLLTTNPKVSRHSFRNYRPTKAEKEKIFSHLIPYLRQVYNKPACIEHFGGVPASYDSAFT